VCGFEEVTAAICMMLDDREAMDLEKALEYVLSCQSYDGGFGLCPGLEPHGGATYCAVATLKLVGQLTPKSENGDKFVALLPGHESLIGWCLRVGLLSHCVTVFVQILIYYVIWS
jgi:geranylgeranyl transferase type-1 subunit beta